jgi:hypothetical protein
MVGARREVASEIGSAMVDGCGMRAAADDCGQPRVIVKACYMRKVEIRWVVTIYVWEPNVQRTLGARG